MRSKFLELIKKLWPDPVWSKVIASIIVGVGGLIIVGVGGLIIRFIFLNSHAPEQSPKATITPENSAHIGTTKSEERPPLQHPVSEAVRKYSPEALQRRRHVLDEYAAKINGPVLAAFRYGRKVWDEWNNNQISPQILADRAEEFKKEAIAAFEQIDELWRIYRFDYPEITDLPNWTYEAIIGKTNLLLQELIRFARLNETDARAALMNNRFIEDWYTGLNEFDQWIIAKRKLIAEKRKEYENVEASGAQ